MRHLQQDNSTPRKVEAMLGITQYAVNSTVTMCYALLCILLMYIAEMLITAA